MGSCKNYAQLNREAYDRLAWEYRARAQNPSPYSETPEYLVEQTVELLRRPSSYAKALEVGPGAGQVLAELERRGFETEAVELSPSMAQVAAETSPKTKIQVADIMDVTFPSQYFDLIFMGAVIHLLPRGAASTLLRRVRTWLKNDGVAFINTTIHDEMAATILSKKDYAERIPRFRVLWTEAGFLNLILQAGLHPQKRLETHEIDRRKHWVAFVCTASGYEWRS